MYRMFAFLLLLCLGTASLAAGSSAQFSCPQATDATSMIMGRRGELIIATKTGVICSVSPGGDCVILAEGLGGPCCLAASARGDLYAGSMHEGSVVRLDATGRIETVASGLGEIRALAVDRDGAVFVVGGSDGSVRRVHAADLR